VREEIQDLIDSDAVTCAHGLGRIQGESAREDRDTREEHTLALDQQVIAPVQCGLQRSLPTRRYWTATGEKLEATIEPGRQLRGAEQLHACRRQLERERDAV
jgi:hypothetical protein